MRSIARLRFMAGLAESVVLPIMPPGKVHFGDSQWEKDRKMAPSYIVSAVSLLPSDSPECPAQPPRVSSSIAQHHSDSVTQKLDKPFQGSWPVLHDRGQQPVPQAHAAPRHHAVPALEAALQGAKINNIRDGALHAAI